MTETLITQKPKARHIHTHTPDKCVAKGGKKQFYIVKKKKKKNIIKWQDSKLQKVIAITTETRSQAHNI